MIDINLPKSLGTGTLRKKIKFFLPESWKAARLFIWLERRHRIIAAETVAALHALHAVLKS